VAGQPDGSPRLGRLGEGRQPAPVLDEIVDRPDDGPVALSQAVADLVEGPQLDP